MTFLNQVRLQYNPATPNIPPTRKFRDADIGSSITETKIHITKILEDPETRRVLFDHRQARIFGEMLDFPDIPDKMRMPFNQLYIEFTEGIQVSENEDKYQEEKLWAVIVIAMDDDVASLTFFFKDDESNTYRDASFGLDLVKGDATTKFRNLRSPEFQVPEHQLGINDNQTVLVRRNGYGRGWWERQCSELSRFLSWVLTYMTARGIVIVQDPLSRQQRRSIDRMRPEHRPSPWHRVYVVPTKVSENEEGLRRSPSYRYDVRGHMRLGRHKKRDGTYIRGWEWVRPHQRGLKHSMYVPSTHVYEKGKAPEIVEEK